MKELKCPKCGNVFAIDETDYAEILQQVKTAEFDAEVVKRVAEIRKCDEQEHRLAAQQQEIKVAGDRRQLEDQIAALKQELKGKDNAQKVAVLEESLKAKTAIAQKDAEIERLRNDSALKLKAAQEQVDFYKDMKLRMSTKMVGESLEVHCSTQYNQMMRTLLPRAVFGKDNEVVEGTKADFVFRDYGEDGTEYISIIFEMKNETETDGKKHRNEEFFKKLDEDRRKKGCEFAVLVSLLEPDSELYNGGIVDVSYRYDKMYVIRPQFFLPIIQLLVQTSKKSLEYKQQLAVAKQQSIDVTNFEEKIEAIKKGFGYQYEQAKGRFNDAIAAIDKSIQALQDTRAKLLGSADHLRLANNKLEDLTVKKLTRGNPTMKQMIADAKTVTQDNHIA